MAQTKIDVSSPRKALEEARHWVSFQATLPVDERSWDQGTWVTQVTDKRIYQDTGEQCGTVFCIAGYIGQLGNPVFRKDEYALINGEDTHVEYFARDLLGGRVSGYSPEPLTEVAQTYAEDYPEESKRSASYDGGYFYDLFEPDNTINDCLAIIDHLLDKLDD